MSPRILAFTRYDRIGASSRIRFLQHIPHLERMGARITVEPLLPPDYLPRLYKGSARTPAQVASGMLRRFWKVVNEHDADIIWLQREMLPFAPFTLEKLLLAKRKLVIDMDDAHHLYYKNHASWLGRTAYRGKIDSLIKIADAVVVGNPALAEHAREVGALNVHEVPSAVDVARFKSRANATQTAFQIGWIGTPITANQSLPMVREPLLRFLSDFDAECVLIGVGEDQFPEIPARRVAWSEAAEEEFLPRMSAGICPLEDTPWNRGKSGYKIIQYMASGKPSLVSPVGIAKTMISHGATGFHCQNSEDWYSHLAHLCEDAGLRATMGHKALEVAKEKYETAAAAATLYRIFEDCLRG
jgi:glycosyltransferase involved in cell wall biosynthesis